MIYTHAGPEIGVASTKGFLTQLAACYLLGLYLAQVRGMKYSDEIRLITTELAGTPELIQQMLDGADRVYELARELADRLGGRVTGEGAELAVDVFDGAAQVGDLVLARGLDGHRLVVVTHRADHLHRHLFTVGLDLALHRNLADQRVGIDPHVVLEAVTGQPSSPTGQVR